MLSKAWQLLTIFPLTASVSQGCFSSLPLRTCCILVYQWKSAIKQAYHITHISILCRVIYSTFWEARSTSLFLLFLQCIQTISGLFECPYILMLCDPPCGAGLEATYIPQPCERRLKKMKVHASVRAQRHIQTSSRFHVHISVSKVNSKSCCMAASSRF